MSEDWGAVRARLEQMVEDDPRWADIRAALERDKQQMAHIKTLREIGSKAQVEATALRQRVEELEARVECAHCGFVWTKGEEPRGHECSMNPLVVARDSLRGEVRALRQRVEELERADARNKAELRGADDEIKHQARRAKSAEANLARCHGALTDAGSVVVPGTLEGDLAPAIRQLTRERDEARPEVSRLEGLIVALSEDERGLVTAHVHAEADRIRTMRAIAEIARLREALEAVLTESGLQAHKYGCKDRLCRPAQWDEVRPCAGCRAEAALRGGGK